MDLMYNANISLKWMPIHEDGFCCRHCVFESKELNCPRDSKGKELCRNGYYVFEKLFNFDNN